MNLNKIKTSDDQIFQIFQAGLLELRSKSGRDVQRMQHRPLLFNFLPAQTLGGASQDLRSSVSVDDGRHWRNYRTSRGSSRLDFESTKSSLVREPQFKVAQSRFRWS